MSNNSPPVTIRIPPLILAAMDSEIESANEVWKPGTEWNRSRFMLFAISSLIGQWQQERETAAKAEAAKGKAKPKKNRKK